MEAESSVGIDPKAQADSVAKDNSEAGPGAGSEFELWKSDAARARNRAACIVGNQCGVGRGHNLRGSRGIRSR